jgi:hypothetical protein
LSPELQGIVSHHNTGLALVTPLAQQDKDSAAQSYFGDDAPVTGITPVTGIPSRLDPTAVKAFLEEETTFFSDSTCLDR